MHMFPCDFRSLFVWRPKEKSESVKEKGDQRIVLCGKPEKGQRGKKFGDESDDDSDHDDGFSSRGKKHKHKEVNLSSSSHRKRKAKR